MQKNQVTVSQCHPEISIPPTLAGTARNRVLICHDSHSATFLTWTFGRTAQERGSEELCDVPVSESMKKRSLCELLVAKFR